MIHLVILVPLGLATPFIQQIVALWHDVFGSSLRCTPSKPNHCEGNQGTS